MARSSYGYQYETSPRKIEPEYTSRRKTKAKTKKAASKKNSTKAARAKEKKQKEQLRLENKAKRGIATKAILIFLIFFAVIFRSSQVNQKFAQIQSIKSTITEIQKENNQLEINIQNSLNLNNIEQSAKELLGMQKLTNKQTVYVSLSKKDYVEPRTEKVIIEDSRNIIEKIVDSVKGLF